MKKNILLVCLLAFFGGQAQDDLLNEIDTAKAEPVVESAFKALKIVNLESTKLAAKGDFYFIVAHRFASIETGFEDFFGLDNAVTQLKFLYGATDWLTIAAGRSEQAYDFSAKYSLVRQKVGGFPVAIVGFNSLGINNELDKAIYPRLEFNNRLIYVSQLLVSRKFSKRLSLELAPTFFHENFVDIDSQDNSQFAIGMGGRYKISNRVSINVDYAAHLNRSADSPYRNPLSVGVDVETGGHVFQMHFSNSQGIHEAGFLGRTTGDWSTANIFFGFNLVRVF
ncbi:DUF5777 family beta-barrel protein [Flavobacterium sp.]|uniref:DUF5777 family beta-barrel protein n=1 Tax=Flavobacterium sp. TaxID=239 RepID=UPI002622B318|nr:DUF5777 family beta-barrel protein [Flavobacterium sp.]